MKLFGLLVCAAGLATFAPLYFSFQTKMMQPISAYQPWGGIVVAIVGAMMLLLAPKKAHAKK